MKYDFITIGGATEDITFFTNEGVIIKNKEDVLHENLLAFKYGAKIKIEKAHSTFGGGASNTAVNFSGLGFRSASLICVGKDERGEKVIKNLKQKKVDTSLVQKVSSSETGFSFLLVAQGNEHIVFSNRGANSELRIKNEELKIMKNTEWIYLTSLSGKWEEVLRKVFSVSEVKFAWNPGHVQLKAGIKKIGRFLKQTNILFVNKDEANELAMSDPAYNKNNYEFFGNIKNLLKILKSYGPEIVVITNGRKGADAFDGVNFYHQDIMRERKVVDTTGVGDAFNSSFVAGLKLFKGDIQKAMHLGIKNTSLVVAKQGAQNGLLTRRQIVA